MTALSDPIHVLHVDDEAEFAEMVATFLEDEDDRLAVRTATSAEEGLGILSDGEIDCVVSDYDMPGRNGIEFLEAVREEYPDLPFLMYTGTGSEGIASEAISAGVTDYLRKESGTDQYTILANRIANAVEQRRVEREADRTRRRLRELTESITDCVWLFDREWQDLLFISGYEAVWGRSERAIRENPQDFLNGVHPDDRAFVRDAMDRLSGGTPIDIEYRILKGDGGTGWVWVKGEPIRDETGTVVRVAGFTREITRRKEREDRLERAERRYQAVFEDPNILAGVLDPEGTVLEVNRMALEYVGASREEVTGEPIWETPWWDEGMRSRIRRRVEQAAGGDYVDYEAELTTLDGEPYHVNGLIRPVTDDDGRVVSLIISGRDVTEQKEREAELRTERAFIDQALHVLDDVFYVVNPDGTLRRWNDRLSEVTGYADGEIDDMEATALFAEADRDRVADAIEEALTTGHAIVEADLLTPGGDGRPFEFTGRRLTDPGGDVIGVVGIGRDIAERKEREREVREKSNLLDQLFKQVPIHMYVKDEEARMLRVSEYYTDDPEAYLGKTDREIFTGEHGEQAYADDMQVIETEEPIVNKEEYLPFQEKWHLTSKVPWYGDDGEVRGLIGVTKNITERKRYEQELKRQNERLDEFAGVVSHDLRNPLNVAEGRIALARAEHDVEHLEDAADAVDRSLTLIDDLLALTREGEQVSEDATVDLADTVEDSWRGVRTPGATLRVETDRTIRGDPGRLRQLLENLFRNAVEHGSTSPRSRDSGEGVEHGGDVTVTVGDLDDGFYVEDDGRGIAPEDRERVFEAGYTMATDGTGLGLNIVREIAEAHGWEVRATESPEGGARFELTGVDGAAE